MTHPAIPDPLIDLMSVDFRGYRFSGGKLPTPSRAVKKSNNHHGRRFGMLLAVENLGTTGSANRWWGCHCDCGTRVAVRGRQLVTGGISHCGCVATGEKTCKTCGLLKPLQNYNSHAQNVDGKQGSCKECRLASQKAWRLKNPEEAKRISRLATNKYRRGDPLGALLRGVRHRAKNKGRVCTLSAANLRIPERCPVLGIPLQIYAGSGGPAGGKDNSPSIDRIDNSKGYTPDNVIIISHRANRLKSNSTAAELRRIADFFSELEERRRRNHEAFVALLAERCGEDGARAAIAAANAAGWAFDVPESTP